MINVITLFCGAALCFLFADCINKDARKAATKKRILEIRESYTPETDKSEVTFEDLMDEINHI